MECSRILLATVEHQLRHVVREQLLVTLAVWEKAVVFSPLSDLAVERLGRRVYFAERPGLPHVDELTGLLQDRGVGAMTDRQGLIIGERTEDIVSGQYPLPANG